MRKVLLRREGTASWQQAEEAAFQNEDHLQRLLYDDPRLIPFSDLGEGILEPRVFVRESGLPGSGSTDLIGVDEEGRITIIECKLATNPEQKRKVVGQVLEYASFLWQMSYDSFERLFEKAFRAAGKSGLAALVGPEGDSEWSEPEFRGNVQTTLEAGDFSLIVAVDTLNDELRRIIKYLNRRPVDGTTIYAVELGYFVGDGYEVISPRLEGPVVETRRLAGGRPGWDEVTFFDVASKRCSPEVVRVLHELHDFTLRESDNRAWGRGKDGSFTFRLKRGGITGSASVFSAFTSGRLWLSFGYMKDVPEAAVQRFADDLTSLPGFADLPVKLQAGEWPQYRVEDVLIDLAALQQFEEAVLRVRDSLAM